MLLKWQVTAAAAVRDGKMDWDNSPGISIQGSTGSTEGFNDRMTLVSGSSSELYQATAEHCFKILPETL